MESTQRRLKYLAATVVVVAALAAGAAASAADPSAVVTLAGDIVCGKCTLELPDLDHCQNVLLVGEGAQRQQYWIVGNAVNDEFGDVCTARRPVSVTGTVRSQDGKEWIVPSRIEPRTP